MPYNEEEEGVIRSGTVKQWLKYAVHIGSLTIAGQWLAALAGLILFVVGAVLF